MSQRPRAADDFGAIKNRLAEIAAERAAAAVAKSVDQIITNIAGQQIGGCAVCQAACAACTGACCD